MLSIYRIIFNYNNYITKKIKYQLHLFSKRYCIFSIKVL